MNLKILSKNLFERPDDEHFESLEAVMMDASEAKNTQTEEIVKTNDIIFRPAEEGAISPISMQLASGENVHLSHFPLAQIAKASGISSEVLGKLNVRTACQTLNELYAKAPREEQRSVLLTKERVVRAFTTASYARIWDADILEDVNKIVIPNGFAPTKATINSDSSGTNIKGNTKPALFRGDRDSWYFFTTNESKFGDFGGLYKGVLIGNSEVGAGRSFTARSFCFRGMCANFIIWDVQNQEIFRKWHRGTDRNMQIFHLEFSKWLTEISTDIDAAISAQIETAASTPYVGDGKYNDDNAEKAAKKIAQFGSPLIGMKKARDVVDYAMLEQNRSNVGDPDLSYFSIANGITWAAKDDLRFGANLADYGVLAGQLMAAAAS